MSIGNNIRGNTEEQKKFNDAVNEGFESFRDYGSILKGINEELGKNYNTTKETQKEYNSLISITQKLAGQQEGISRLNDKQLKSLSEKAALNLKELFLDLF